MRFKRSEAAAIRPAFMGPPEGADTCPMCGYNGLRFGGLIAVAENAESKGYTLHVASRATCAEHIAEGDDQKPEFAFAAAAPLDVERMALRTVYHDGATDCSRVRPPQRRDQPMSKLGVSGCPVAVRLTPQERMVLRLYVELERVQLVADDLGLAPSTVKNVLSKVYRKLDTTNRIGAFKAMGWLKLP